MVTTTPAAIAAKIVSVIESLVPVAVPQNNAPFRENKAPHGQLRRWSYVAGSNVVAGGNAVAAGNAVFRLFEIAQEGAISEAPIQEIATVVSVRFRVTVVYPPLPTLYGLDQLRDLEEVISADAQQIASELFMPAALANNAHHATFVTVGSPDRTSDRIWYLDLDCSAVLNKAQ